MSKDMDKKGKYKYYVLYGADGLQGGLEISTDKKIETMKVITDINKYIEDKYKYRNVILQNWIRLRDE